MAQDSNVFVESVNKQVLDTVSTHNVVLALDRIKGAIERLVTVLQSSDNVRSRPGNTPQG